MSFGKQNIIILLYHILYCDGILDTHYSFNDVRLSL